MSGPYHEIKRYCALGNFDEIAGRIRWHRILLGLTQQEYAARAGLERSQLKNWETGRYRLSLDGALALRRVYGLFLDFLFCGVADALPMTLRNAWMDGSAAHSGEAPL